MSGRVVPTRRRRPFNRALLGAAVGTVLVVAMAVDTKVVRIGAPMATGKTVFSPAEFGAAEFPKIQADIEKRAVDAPVLAATLAKDRDAALKQYAQPVGGAWEIPVKFTGIAGKEDLGTYDVAVEGMPPDVRLRVQTGPAIFGTDLRDAPGTIAFGQFTNQIEYQNAGAAINREMKKQVLSTLDTSALEGKTIRVVGAFRTGEPDIWLVTPVVLGTP